MRLWPNRSTWERKPEAEKPLKVELRDTDEPMTRARTLFAVIGMGVRADEFGELMLRRAAECMAHYRDLDRRSVADQREGESKAA